MGRNSAEVEQNNANRELLYELKDVAVDGSIEGNLMILDVMTLPLGGPGKVQEIKKSGWIVRKVFNSLDSSLQKKFVNAISKGIVSPTDSQGILRLTTSEMNKYPEFTHKVKILGKGGDLRIYGKELENGHIVYSLKGGH